jgi:hypothetical protein
MIGVIVHELKRCMGAAVTGEFCINNMINYFLLPSGIRIDAWNLFKTQSKGQG